MSPTCCGQKARWTVISHNLSYWYCGECKKEVDNEDELRSKLSFTPTEDISPVRLTQDEIDALFANINNLNYDPDGDVTLSNHIPIIETDGSYSKYNGKDYLRPDDLLVIDKDTGLIKVKNRLPDSNLALVENIYKQACIERDRQKETQNRFINNVLESNFSAYINPTPSFYGIASETIYPGDLVYLDTHTGMVKKSPPNDEL